MGAKTQVASTGARDSPYSRAGGMRGVRVMLRDWVRQVLSETGWTKREWSARSGVDATTIGRIESGESRGSNRAREELERAFYAWLDEIPAGEARLVRARMLLFERRIPEYAAPRSTRSIPIITLDIMRASGLYPLPDRPGGPMRRMALDETTRAALNVASESLAVPPGRDRCVAVMLTAGTLSLEGMAAGTQAVVDPDQPISQGAAVAVAHDDQIGAYRYYAPWYMPKSHDPSHQPVHEGEGLALGRIVALWREVD